MFPSDISTMPVLLRCNYVKAMSMHEDTYTYPSNSARVISYMDLDDSNACCHVLWWWWCVRSARGNDGVRGSDGGSWVGWGHYGVGVVQALSFRYVMDGPLHWVTVNTSFLSQLPHECDSRETEIC